MYETVIFIDLFTELYRPTCVIFIKTFFSDSNVHEEANPDNCKCCLALLLTMCI